MALGKYRSAAYPTLEEELEHSRTNPLVVGNTYSRISMGDTEIGGFGTPFDSFLPLVKEQWTYDYTAPDVRYNYWPEKLSYDRYDTEDLWYVLMRLNNAFTRSEFIGPNFVCVAGRHAGKILKLCKRIHLESRTPEREVYMDRTLRPVHI